MNADPRLPKTGKLFRNGRSQAVRIPAEYRFEGSEVEFRPGPNPGEVIVAPKLERRGNFEEFFRLQDAIPPEELVGFMQDRDQSGQIRDDPFE